MNRIILFVLFFPLLFTPIRDISRQKPPTQDVVHAILFYSPTCGHCQYVISEVLPPLFEKYGDKLSMAGIDVSQTGGQTLFLNALKYFDLEQGGVPFLVVGDNYLIGSIDIPQQFPGLVEKYLAQGGIDWPSIPGIGEVMNAPQPTEASSATPLAAGTATAQSTSLAPTQTPTSGIILTGEHSNSVGATFANDPLGNSLSVIILGVMIFSAGRAVMLFRRPQSAKRTRSWQWAIPVLCMIGLFVAGYLAYVETNQLEAVCGPVGDCNAVQQSEYARLFGVLPIGVLGMVGYVLILLSWIIKKYIEVRKAAYASLSLLGMSFMGVLFSIYLTFLEPFVIGATCAWCLASAIIMTLLLWLSILPGMQAYNLFYRPDSKLVRKR